MRWKVGPRVRISGAGVPLKGPAADTKLVTHGRQPGLRGAHPRLARLLVFECINRLVGTRRAGPEPGCRG
jgi:hypothetical protein